MGVKTNDSWLFCGLDTGTESHILCESEVFALTARVDIELRSLIQLINLSHYCYATAFEASVKPKETSLGMNFYETKPKGNKPFRDRWQLWKSRSSSRSQI